MRGPAQAKPDNSQPKHVTYVIVVHGMGEQRKNETVTNVINRFAEARRCAGADDYRDVLTLGQVSGQTGLLTLKPPITEQPWIEFDGIPAPPLHRNNPSLKVFLGEPPSKPGDNLRFVDLYWSDVTQESVEHVGQDVDVWAKGLLGRLLRKHEDAVSADNSGARVPFWIRRVLYLLADALLMVRFAMNFRFKEMKDLIFVKFLSDVQLYGEYSRCRGRAVRRFHEVMAEIESAHVVHEKRCGQTREARYVVIAHSLGSVMSFDALLYARATDDVRRGSNDGWVFPGYLGKDDVERKCKHGEEWAEAKGKFAFLDTGWVERVKSFVTLGSPIDKFLTVWWLNYRYLLTCDGSLLQTESRIAHFNYCDELDPVGHNLDIARETPAYKALFECREDVVFNRYTVPVAAHNKYWTDQDLFGWILARGVDGEGKGKRPRWFRFWRVYCPLLFWLYSAVPLLVLLGTYASLSLAFQAPGWRSAATAAAAFSFLAYFGRRLIDLSIWWRQIQRKESKTFWKRDDKDQNKAEQQRIRCRAARWFRVQVRVVPFVWAALTMFAFQALCPAALQGIFGPELARLAMVLIVAFVVVWRVRRILPRAYRTRAVGDDGSMFAVVEAGFLVLVFGALIGLAHLLACVPNHNVRQVALFGVLDMRQVALFGVLATVVYAYRLYRFTFARKAFRRDRSQQAINYSRYASHP